MIPRFKEKALEHKDGHYIVQDWMGTITEISDEYDYTYIRSPKDSVTRRWLKFPVENRKDWEEMKKRGCPMISLDSDGYTAKLIPLWIEAGINCCEPMEVAAENDIVGCRRIYGEKMAYREGIDKRAIAKEARSRIHKPCVCSFSNIKNLALKG